jgi:cation-transporting ATPase E
MVNSLKRSGHVVATTGDGVNDVLALKDADLGVAMGSGSPASKSVAQLVLLDGRFSGLPGVVAEGRRVLGNIERTSNLFLTKTVYAMVLSIATGAMAFPFPFLPRHLTLVGSLTIGIPGFFLALQPSARRALPGMVARVLRFAGPAGFVIAVATLAAYILVKNHAPGATLVEARTAATIVLFWLGTSVLVEVARPLRPLRRILIIAMCVFFGAALVLPGARGFFALDLPTVIVSFAAVGIAALFTSALDLILPRAHAHEG